jgi:y4mF family transcriptional regulator
MQMRSTKDLADAIRGRRLDLGLTQTQLANRARVSRKWVSGVETGKSSVDTGLVLRVLDALGLRIELIAAATTSTKSPQQLNPIDVTALIESMKAATNPPRPNPVDVTPRPTTGRRRPDE